MNEVSSVAPAATRDERTWAMVSHVSAFAGLVVPSANLWVPLLVWRLKREGRPLVDDQGRESVNFQISVSLYMLVASVLAVIGIGIALIFLLLLFTIAMVIVATLKADNGERYRYPLNLRFLK